MNLSTKVFLVLLQVAIGWHFLYEGVWKVRVEKNWSSRGYLSAASGPVAPAMRWSAGDPAVSRDGVNFVVDNPTVQIDEYFTIKPIDPNLAPSERRLHQHLPPKLEQEWDAYFQAFLKHYELDEYCVPVQEWEVALPPEFVGTLGVAPGSIAGVPWGSLYITCVPKAWLFERMEPPDPRTQRILAERRLRELKAETVAWLQEGKKKVRRPNIAGPASEVSVSIPERVREYHDADAKARELEATKASMFGFKAVPEVKKARDEANAIRSELLGDISDRTNQMKHGLRDVLSREQRQRPDVPGKAATPAEWTRLRNLDNVVRYGLLIIGALLVLGVFTRSACVAGAIFLLSFYLAMPALPWLPEPAMSEGHYFFINKNIIEMLALLAIACSRPYQRYGFDVWLHPLARRILGLKQATGEPEAEEVRTVAVPDRGTHSNRETDEIVTVHPTTGSDSSHAS
jgi:uncharacterized membrane protein YphA (DoxX/SURF4 family)